MELVLPVVFMLIMGFALLAYVVLDGFDLGIGSTHCDPVDSAGRYRHHSAANHYLHDHGSSYF